MIADVPICTGTDATAYDPGTKMVFASCSDGSITAAKVDGDQLTVVQTIQTARGARTMAVDPSGEMIYLPTSDLTFPAGSNAEHPRPAPVPGTFRILVVTRGGTH